MALEIEYIDMKDDLSTRVIRDMHDVAVAEKGNEPGLSTLMECALIYHFSALKVKQKSGLIPDLQPEQEKLHDRYGIVPRPLSFWTTAFIHSPNLMDNYVRHLIWRWRDRSMSYTVLDQ